jgi:DNA-binding GntR family transcriptional regulator
MIRLAGNVTLERVWRSLEPFSRTYITLVAPGADEHWTANLHPAILEALRTRDPERVVQALRRHFDEAGAHLAGGWQNDPPATTRAPSGKGRRRP